MAFPQQFFKQNPCTEANPGKFIIADEVPSGDPKKTTRRFYAFDSVEHFYNCTANYPPEKRNYYEVAIQSQGHNRKLYYDIEREDFGPEDSLDGLRMEMLEYVKSKTTDFFASQYNIQLEDSHFVVSDASNDSKLSLHVVVDGYHFGPDHEVLQDVFTQMFGPGSHKDKQNLDKYIDSGVYSTTRQMRILGSTKLNKNRTLWPFVNGKVVKSYTLMDQKKHTIRSLGNEKFIAHQLSPQALANKELARTAGTRKYTSPSAGGVVVQDAELTPHINKYLEVQCEGTWVLDPVANRGIPEKGWGNSIKYTTYSPDDCEGYCPIHKTTHRRGIFFVFQLNTYKLFQHCYSQDPKLGEKAILVWEKPLPFMRHGLSLTQFVEEMSALLSSGKSDEVIRKEFANKVKQTFRAFPRNGQILYKDESGELVASQVYNVKKYMNYTIGKGKEKLVLDAFEVLKSNSLIVDRLVCRPFLDYDPYESKPSVINTFVGFAAKTQPHLLGGVLCSKYCEGTTLPPYPEILKPWMRHIREVICDNDPVAMHYLLMYFAYVIQTGKRPQVMLLIQGSLGGEGKSVFLGFLKNYIFGQKSSLETSLEKVLGYNIQLQQHPFVFINELKTQSTFTDWDQFKTMVTDGEISVHGKGSNYVKLENYCTYIATSNHNPLPDKAPILRRVFELIVSSVHRGKSGYFHKLHQSLNQETGDAFITYVAALALGDFKPWNIPECSHRKKQKFNTRSYLKKFFHHVLGMNQECQDHIVDEEEEYYNSDDEDLPEGPPVEAAVDEAKESIRGALEEEDAPPEMYFFPTYLIEHKTARTDRILIRDMKECREAYFAYCAERGYNVSPNHDMFDMDLKSMGFKGLLGDKKIRVGSKNYVGIDRSFLLQ